MSKSLGNYYTARELIDDNGGLVVRMGLISGHYRSSLDWNRKVIENARNNVKKVKNCLAAIEQAPGGSEESLNQFIDEIVLKFEDAMDDDFNTPKALAVIYEYVKKLNTSLDSKKEILKDARVKLLELLNILGLDFEKGEEKSEVKLAGLMDLIITIRNTAREEKNFKMSDEIRENLRKVGIQIEDGAEGTNWKIFL